MIGRKGAAAVTGNAGEKKTYSREGYLEENYHYFHLRDTAGQERDFHFHEFDKIVLLLSGRVEYAVEGSAYDLRPWDILLVKHHAIHKAMIDKSEPYERIILYLDGSYYNQLLPEARLTDCFDEADRRGEYRLVPDEGQKRELEETLQAFERAQRDKRFGSETLRDTYIVQLLVQIGRISPVPERAGREALRPQDPRNPLIHQRASGRRALGGGARGAGVPEPLSLHAPFQGPDRRDGPRLRPTEAAAVRGTAHPRRSAGKPGRGRCGLHGLLGVLPRVPAVLRRESRRTEMSADRKETVAETHRV